jgi:hypothetical protein
MKPKETEKGNIENFGHFLRLFKEFFEAPTDELSGSSPDLLKEIVVAFLSFSFNKNTSTMPKTFKVPFLQPFHSLLYSNCLS